MNNSFKNIFLNGTVRKNPVFIMLLGLCPTLAVTTMLTNAFGMGAAVIFVLVLSNILISILRKFIPSTIRIPAYIGIIAALVTIIQMVMHAYLPSIYVSLGVYLPLIVVNCIILERAESFASKNGPLRAAVDGLAVGLGFTIALATISFFRELLGSGTLFGVHVLPSSMNVLIMTLPPGAFLTLGIILGVFQYRKVRKEREEA